MRKSLFIVFFFFVGINSSLGQKLIVKEFSAQGLQKLSIIDDSIFNIKIISSERESVKLEVHISGEHSEAIIIEEILLNGQLSLKTAVMPYFTFEDDKLAAHKIMAIEAALYIPETISVEIKSKLASLETTGKIPKLSVALQKGSCTLIDFLGNSHIKTVDGNINITAQKEVFGKAISKNGTVENAISKRGKFLVEAETVNGNIYMLQTK